MPVHADFLTYVTDQLAAFAPVTSRRMFGGVGLYARELFFALIDDDTLYFKVDASNRDDYIQRGCTAFQPLLKRGDPLTLGYYSVPLEVLEDSEQLASWAEKSWQVAAAKAATKARRGGASAGKTSAQPRRRKQRAGTTRTASATTPPSRSAVRQATGRHRDAKAAATKRSPKRRRAVVDTPSGVARGRAAQARRVNGNATRTTHRSLLSPGGGAVRSDGTTRARRRVGRSKRNL